jgi:hypothetical protein
MSASPKATELQRRREMWRWASCCREQVQQILEGSIEDDRINLKQVRRHIHDDRQNRRSNERTFLNYENRALSPLLMLDWGT